MMVEGLMQAMMLSAGMLFIVFVVLLIVWAMGPVNKKDSKDKVRKDLKKIKDQINGD
jgi:hypothetical protein